MSNPGIPSPEMSMANTKKEMLEAYGQLQKALEEQRKQDMKPAEKIAEKKKVEAVTVADSLSLEGIAKEIGNLKGEVGKMLADLSDKLEEEIGNYVQVKGAVAAKEQELEEIYEIGKTASSLTALLEVQQRQRQAFDEQMSAQRAELEEEIEASRSEWEREREAYEAGLKERKAAENTKREREAEEHKYGFEREQKLTREEFEYEKAKLEREAAIQREEMERDLSEREKAVVAHEQELNELRQKVDAFPAGLQGAVNKAVEEVTARLKADADGKQALLQREYDGEKNVAQSRIEALEQAVTEQRTQITTLSEQLEKSRNQVQDIAVKAIEGSSNLKVIAAPPALAPEPPRRAQQGEK